MERGLQCALCVCALLAGCAAPLPVADFASDKERDELPFITYQPLDNLNSLADAEDEFEAYFFLYSHSARQLRRKSQNASEVGFYSSLVAVLGGIAKSRDPALAGGAIAAGSSFYSERYKLEVQTANYDRAAKAMRCMYIETGEARYAELDKVRLQLSRGVVEAEPEAVRIARDSFLEVRDQLESLQSKVTLGTPDFSKLKELAAGSKDKPLAGANFVGATANAPITNDVAEQYRNRMKACTALITG